LQPSLRMCDPFAGAARAEAGGSRAGKLTCTGKVDSRGEPEKVVDKDGVMRDK
jgi:hypothetical protein